MQGKLTAALYAYEKHCERSDYGFVAFWALILLAGFFLWVRTL